MPTERLPMRKVREVLRLKHACGASDRLIAQSLGIGRTTVGEYLRRAAVVGLTWPVELDDAELERLPFTPAGFYEGPTRPQPDWSRMHAELRRRGVTLMLLWEEYRAEHPDGYGYSRFCDLYGEWRKGVTATMRQTHVAGEKLFVDFAGDTVPVIDGLTGEVRAAHVFVAVLGASNYTFAEARWSEGLADWIGAHVDALAFLGGVPKLIVCDNLKAGVTAACRYEPGINRTYQDMAAHYGTSILPARVRRPRDKAKVENSVLIVERFILARLRNRQFFSLEELNQAIRELLDELNATERDNKRLVTRLKFASLRQSVVIEDIDLRAVRGLDRALFQKLAAGDWIDRHHNLLICGPTGVGKSWIACALGHKACRDGRSVLYHRMPRLFEALALARGDGRHARLLKTLARVQLLILDDWGLAPLAPEQRRDLLEIMDDRHGRATTIETSQLPVDAWHATIGDPTLADAILDRLVHNAHRLTLKGDSMRKAAAKTAPLDLGSAA